MPALPTLEVLKSEARALRADAAAAGRPLTQSKALEQVARRHGVRDWNTAAALARRNAPDTPAMVGQRVRGRFLGQPFAGEVLGLEKQGSHWKISLRFDQPVDVVEFESFSNFRRQVSALVGADGVSPARRSDGTPHLVLAP
ncbi:glyoxalase superfamily protein [Mangrovicoccus sp. HB161399]|uniref:glyoxalase superfamily protein n=1 Tax=Mangrovicoccus sp. HB161399 TaxID=2720392 RepID=UPI0015535A60|nr:glyoxalase superfamily protein [Mangrovicoccus sp. HB161399]